MHRRETRVLLRHYLEQGLTKTELAKRFGISRRTVYHWIETGQLDRDLDSQEVRYRPRPPVVTRLEPYKPIIQARLEALPLLTAQRLFEELRGAGYSGGYTQLKDYVRQVRPHAPAEPVVRFETPPGYQGQVDFGTFQLPWGRRHALLVVLGYSRLLWMRFFARQTMTTLIRWTGRAPCIRGSGSLALAPAYVRSATYECLLTRSASDSEGSLRAQESAREQ